MDPLKYTDAEFTVGLKIVKAIAKRPALSMRQFEHSFLNQKIFWPLRIIVGGELYSLSIVISLTP